MLVLILATLPLAGCAPARPSLTTAGDPPQFGAPRVPTRVTAAIGAEITSLASKLEPQRTYGGEYGFLSNSPLALQDAQGRVTPLLASELPARDVGTWTVSPDGTMTTTWKIRSNAKWHDGQPVVARDFVFALRIYSDPGMPIREREPERFMDRVEPVDDRTFIIRWKQPYPWANELINRQLEALPAHIMESVLDAGDREAFLNHAFWTSTSYVGNGPYRLVQWDLGSQLVYRAFDDYFLGRPKIDEVIIRIIPDTNTLVSNILSGAVDTTLGITLGLQAGATVREQWGPTGDGQVIIVPARYRYTQIQLDPGRNGQPALFDARVRRAITHALDRQTLAEITTQGTSGVAEVMMSPNDPLYPRVEQAIAKYPYDPTRASALLQEAGWSRRGDALENAAGQPFRLDIWNTQGRDNETEMGIMAADLARIGLAMGQNVIPQSRISETEYRVTFPGLNLTAVPIDIPASMNVVHSDQCPTAERRFVGTNRGCWKNAEFDRLYITASTSLEAQERADAVVQALRVMTEEAGIIGIAYNAESIPVRRGLVGPGPRWPGQVGTTWNVHLWHWAT
jgi:peptide/nickel transport system substrate-binding protein